MSDLLRKGPVHLKPATMDLVAEEETKCGAEVAAQMAAPGALDEIFAKIDSGELDLTGAEGFIPGLVKAALERRLQTELTDHLGYEKGAAEASAFAISRNGSTAKRVATIVGDIELNTSRDREGSLAPRLVPKESRRLGGLDDMIISLYAGGMTIRDIEHRLRSRLGTERPTRRSARSPARSSRRYWPGSAARSRRSTP